MRLLDYDPLSKTATYHHYNHHTKETTITTQQDYSAILDKNQRLYNDDNYKKDGIKNEWMHVGTIPNQIILELKMKGIDVFNKEHMPRVFKLLQDRDYRKLATVRGKF